MARVLLNAAGLVLAGRHLAAVDDVMGDLVARLPAAKLARRQAPFHVLVVSVINQQLSQKAAATIEGRVAALSSVPFSPAAVGGVSDEALRGAGLSRSKVAYLRALVGAAEEGRLEAGALGRMSDEEVVAHLTAIRGVGVWTAEMFLMFCLRRPDVLSLGDAGLLRAARNLYGARFEGGDAEVLTQAAEVWRPWRTVGCYYLWRSLDASRQK